MERWETLLIELISRPTEAQKIRIDEIKQAVMAYAATEYKKGLRDGSELNSRI